MFSSCFGRPGDLHEIALAAFLNDAEPEVRASASYAIAASSASATPPRCERAFGRAPRRTEANLCPRHCLRGAAHTVSAGTVPEHAAGA